MPALATASTQANLLLQMAVWFAYSNQPVLCHL
jgi:hypothetical protein